MTAKTTTRKRKGRSQADIDARAARAAELREQLGTWQEETDEADVAAAVAMFAAIDDGYSERNAMLIAMQDPQATDVRGYRAWQDAGRQVTAYPEGQGGITILAYRGQHTETTEPAEEGGDPEEKIWRHFALATVHDVRRTVRAACECGLPVHRTGYDATAKRHTWTHDEQPAQPHEVKPARASAPAA